MFAAMGVESGVVRGYSVYTLGVQCGGVGDFLGNSGGSDLELEWNYSEGVEKKGALCTRAQNESSFFF